MLAIAVKHTIPAFAACTACAAITAIAVLPAAAHRATATATAKPPLANNCAEGHGLRRRVVSTGRLKGGRGRLAAAAWRRAAPPKIWPTRSASVEAAAAPSAHLPGTFIGTCDGANVTVVESLGAHQAGAWGRCRCRAECCGTGMEGGGSPGAPRTTARAGPVRSSALPHHLRTTRRPSTGEYCACAAARGL